MRKRICGGVPLGGLEDPQYPQRVTKLTGSMTKEITDVVALIVFSESWTHNTLCSATYTEIAQTW